MTRAIVTTTAPELIKAYGQKPTKIPNLLCTNFGKSGLLTPELETILGIEQCGSYYWLIKANGRIPVFSNETIYLLD